jgi:hypothetical protein
MVDEYNNMNIYSDREDEEGELDTGQPSKNVVHDMIRGQKVIQLKTNYIPRG